MSKSNSISFPIMIFVTWRALVCIGPYNNQLIWLKVAEIRAMNNSSLIRRIIQCNKVKNLYLKHIINKETWPHDLTDIFCILTFFFCGTFKEYSVNILTLVHDSGFCCPIPDIVNIRSTHFVNRNKDRTRIFTVHTTTLSYLYCESNPYFSSWPCRIMSCFGISWFSHHLPGLTNWKFKEIIHTFTIYMLIFIPVS